jgi:threonine synthase
VRYVSTRKQAPPVSFSEALLAGLAPDGGLYVPEHFPVYDAGTFDATASFCELAEAFLEPFLEGDPLAPELQGICQRAFDFPLPLVALRDGLSVLELFHGPTASFKDVGARFLAESFELLAAGETSRRTVLVATSGDTGGAVAAAFHRKRAARVGVLFPAGGVSPRQEKHLTCWDDNITSVRVRGSFDDCQHLVKQAFSDEQWRHALRLTSANSINIGRLLPQAAFYAATALRHQHLCGGPAGFIIPAGNIGNSTGAFWSRRMGFPIGHLALACNANRTVPDWFATGEWRHRPSVRTLANAMDVGAPSNMERLFDLIPDRAEFLNAASAISVDDDTIRRVIAEGPERWERVWCPHTATAIRFHEELPAGAWIAVATAHPAKFDSIVEPLIGRRLDVPAPLAALLLLPERVTEIEVDPEELQRVLA